MSRRVEDLPIVIDNGSGMLKAGFASHDSPQVVFPCVIGRIRKGLQESMVGIGHKQIWIGDEAQSMRGFLTLKYPIEHGIVQNFDDLEQIWHHMFFNELRVAPEEHPIMISEPILGSKVDREKKTQLLFETFNAPACYYASSARMALYGEKKYTGVVVDIGHSCIQVVPIYEGHMITHGVRRMNLGGRDLVHFFIELLKGRGISLKSSSEVEFADYMLQRLGYVALNFEDELATARTSSVLDKPFEMSDGQILWASSERFRATEAMFQPALLGIESLGLHELVYDAIMRCDIDLRRSLFYDIVLVGGVSMFPGLSERLSAELKAKVGPSVKIKIQASPARQYSAWLGMSLFAAPRQHVDWVSREDYNEEGPRCTESIIL